MWEEEEPSPLPSFSVSLRLGSFGLGSDPALAVGFELEE